MENVEKTVVKAMHGDIVTGLPEEFTYDKYHVVLDGEHFDTSLVKNMTPIERSLVHKRLALKAFVNIIRRPFNVQIRADDLSAYYGGDLLESYNTAKKQINMMIDDNPNQIDFVTKDDIRDYDINSLYLENENEVFLRINIKNIHITPKAVGRINLSDAVIFIDTRCNFYFYEESKVFGNKCFRPLHHPHISSDAHPCAGGFKNDFNKYLKDGNIYLLYGALRAFLVKYNGNSPYWDPHKILKKTFTYSDENGNNLKTFEFEGKERADFENGFWLRDASNPRSISRKECIKIFNTVYLKTNKAGWGMYECCLIVYLILGSLENRMRNPRNHFESSESYVEYLRDTEQDDTLHLYRKERDIMKACSDQNEIHREVRYDNRYFDSTLPSSMHVDICDEFRSLIDPRKLNLIEDASNNSMYEKWEYVFNNVPDDIVHYFTKDDRNVKLIKYVNDSYDSIMKTLKHSNRSYKSTARNLTWRELPNPDTYITIKKTAYKNKLKKLDNYIKKIERLRVLFKRDLYNCVVANFKNTMERMNKDAKRFNIFSKSEMQSINQSITEQQTP